MLDLGRVIGPEPLSHLGNLMIRHPQYFRAFFLLLMTSAIQNNNGKKAAASFVMLFSIKAIGMVLKLGPALLLNRLKKTAYLAGHHYNVAQKRSALLHHCDLLWLNVYEIEARVRFTKEELAAQHARDARLSSVLNTSLTQLPAWVKREIYLTNESRASMIASIKQAFPVSTGIEKSCDSFLTSLKHALKTDYDRYTQTHLTGLDVNSIEDFIRTPILDELDRFPGQNWSGNGKLIHLRRRLKHYMLPASYKRAAGDYTPCIPVGVAWLRNLHRNTWHSLVTNVITKRSGTAIRKLTRCCRAEDVSVQTILWPMCSDAPWLDDYPGLRETIVAVRQHMLDQAFGETAARTEIMIDRLTRWDELQAMNLRAQSDHRYCDLNEEVNLYADFSRMGDFNHLLPSIKAFMSATQDQLADFENWLKQQSHDIWRQDLKRTPIQRMRQIGRFFVRLQQCCREHCPEHVELLEEYGAQLEHELVIYQSDQALRTAGIPQELITLCHRYEAFIENTCADLFVTDNATALRAALTAFHGNINHIRTRFYALKKGPIEQQVSLQQDVQRLVGEAIQNCAEYTEELIEMRTHHAICKMQRLIYTEFVEDLRVPDRETRRERIRKRIAHLKARLRHV